MKTCFKCHASKPRDCFYAHPQMADGLLGKCKECTKKDVRANRLENVQRYRDYDKARLTPERRRAGYRSIAKARKADPVKAQARVRLYRAVKKGIIIRLPCAVCGALKVEGHHEDYTKPLDVTWLCALHHGKKHNKYQEVTIDTATNQGV